MTDRILHAGELVRIGGPCTVHADCPDYTGVIAPVAIDQLDGVEHVLVWVHAGSGSGALATSTPAPDVESPTVDSGGQASGPDPLRGKIGHTFRRAMVEPVCPRCRGTGYQGLKHRKCGACAGTGGPPTKNG